MTEMIQGIYFSGSCVKPNFKRTNLETFAPERITLPQIKKLHKDRNLLLTCLKNYIVHSTLSN